MKLLAVDIEATGLRLRHEAQPFAVSATSITGRNYFWKFRVDPFTRKVIYDKPTVNKIIKVINDHDNLVFHNAKFDLLGLRKISSRLSHNLLDKSHTIHETMRLAHIADSSEKKGLKDQGVLRLGILDTKERVLDEAVAASTKIASKLGFLVASKANTPYIEGTYAKADLWVPREVAIHENYPLSHKWHTVLDEYAVEDTEITIQLFLEYIESLEQYMPIYDAHRPLTGVLARLEDCGVHVLPKKLTETRTKYATLHSAALSKLHTLSPISNFNHASEHDIRDILFGQFKYEPYTYGKSGPSIDKNVLKHLITENSNKEGTQFCEQLLIVRKIEKTQQALDGYDKNKIDDYLYTDINEQGTATVRMSSSKPNINNVGKTINPYEEDTSFKVREVFGPDDDRIWFCGDYSQFQIRIFAFAAQDKYLLERLAAGDDCHDAVAKRMYQTDVIDELQRRAAKNINFGIIFGAGKRKIESMSGVKGSYDLYVKQFPSVIAYLEKCATQARKYGYVETLGGYPLKVPRSARYVAANYIIQGTEADIVKSAMIKIDRYLYNKNSSLQMILPVHDELVFDGDRQCNYMTTLSDIRSIMIYESEKYGIPASVDFKYTITNWADTHVLQ